MSDFRELYKTAYTSYVSTDLRIKSFMVKLCCVVLRAAEAPCGIVPFSACSLTILLLHPGTAYIKALLIPECFPLYSRVKLNEESVLVPVYWGIDISGKELNDAER